MFRLRSLLITLVMFLGACGGGGGVGVSIDTVGGTGSFTVTVSGLPSGVEASVFVTGPNNFNQRITATRTLINLLPGSYRVAAGNVVNGNTLYVPSQTQDQIVTVGNGAALTNPTVSYTQQGSLTLTLQQVVSGLAMPVYLTAPTGDTRQFVVERPGRIRVLQQGILQTAPFLDISQKVSTDGERGLLSMAFHPQYASNGFFFVYYTDVSGNIVIERYRVSVGDPNQADPTSSLRIIAIPHPTFNNHNGGLLTFGPDGFLYFGTGDGGGAGDPNGNAQNLGVLLGKMLRIDVNNASLAQPYVVPVQNPFVTRAGGRAEIWAYGLRNPWRFAFDTVSSQLYIADVGQSQREEIDVVPAGQGGANFGWNITEGSLCFGPGQCNRQGQTPPVFEYAHGSGANTGCSITGGFVYRGTAIPELQGRYFYSDYCAGGLRSLLYANGTVREQIEWTVPATGQVLSFGQDAQNELYLLSATGTVYRIARQ